jgi:hypothetical protein
MDTRQHVEFLVEQLLREERSRIRRELLAEIDAGVLNLDELRLAVDRILPEEG